MTDQPLPAGVVGLSEDEAIDMGRHLDPVSAAYNLGARRGYEAGLEAAAKVCEQIQAQTLSIQTKDAQPGSIDDSVNVNIRMTALLLPECAAAIRQLKGKQ